MKTFALWSAVLAIAGLASLGVWAWLSSCRYECDHPEAGEDE